MRRAALLFAALSFAGCSSAEEPTPATPRDSRPSVLVIGADDLASRAVAAFGGLPGYMPNLDRLARSGFAFRRAVVSTPLCTPSRHSFLTGRFPHAIGVTRLESPLAPGIPTLASVFRAAGYATGAFGKMHWVDRPEGETYGFDEIADFPEWREGLTPEERAVVAEHRSLWVEHEEAGWSRYNLEGEPLRLPEDRTDAAYYVDRTIEFVEQARGRPFLAFCSFYETHVPFTFPESYLDRVTPETVEIVHEDLAALEASAPGLYQHRLDQIARYGPFGDDELRELTASYLRSAAWLDFQIGRLLDRLEATGRADDTIVVFWSDHGFFLGEHGLTGKTFFFREVVEAPLVLRVPGHPWGEPRAIDALVQMVDVFPTLCELCGVKPPERLDGTSLVPLLRDRDEPHKAAFCALPGAWASLITDRWKLVIGASPGRGVDQLYDLANDPHERRNLVYEDELRPVVANLLHRLHRRFELSRPDAVPEASWMKDPDAMKAVRSAVGYLGP